MQVKSFAVAVGDWSVLIKYHLSYYFIANALDSMGTERHQDDLQRIINNEVCLQENYRNF